MCTGGNAEIEDP